VKEYSQFDFLYSVMRKKVDVLKRKVESR
jgi:hypothetical protein